MAEDRDFLRIYADPSIPHEEKLRLLSGDDLPEMPKPAPPEGRLALGDGVGGGGNVPESRADVGPSYAPGAGGSFGQPSPSPDPNDPNVDSRPTSVQSPTAVPGTIGLRTAATDEQEFEQSISHLAPESQKEARASRIAATGEPAATGDDATLAAYPGGGEGGGAPGAKAFRASADKAALALQNQPAGVQALPQEQVSEESVVERGSFSPEAKAQYATAQAEADRLQLEAQQLQIDQEERANRVQLAALDKQAEEARALDAIRREEFGKAKRARERANAISEEIAAMPPAEEGLFVGKNFGESLLTVLGVLGMGLGMGGTGDTAQIMPTLRQMSLREVDRQKRFHDLKLGAVDEQDSIYARHMANFQDADLASKATTADIMRGAERQLLELANDPSASEAKRAQLQASAAQIQAQRLRELAELDAKLGDRAKTATSISYRQTKGTAARRAAEAQAESAGNLPSTLAAFPSNPKPNPRDFMDNGEFRNGGAEFFAAMAEWQGREEEAEQAAIAALKAPPAKSRKATGAKKPSGGEAKLASTAPANDETSDPDGKVRAAELYNAGRVEEAVAALSPNARGYLKRLFDQSKRNLSTGSEKEPRGVEDNVAMADAFEKLIGGSSPVVIIPRSERERMVSDGGRSLFAPTAAAATVAQKQILQANEAISLASQMTALAERFKGSGYKSAEIRGQIASVGSALMNILSKRDEQGVIREGGDETRYQNRAGSAVAEFIQDPTTDPAAAVRETLRLMKMTKQSLLSTLSTDWRDFVSAAPKARRREEP